MEDKIKTSVEEFWNEVENGSIDKDYEGDIQRFVHNEVDAILTNYVDQKEWFDKAYNSKEYFDFYVEGCDTIEDVVSSVSYYYVRKLLEDAIKESM